MQKIAISVLVSSLVFLALMVGIDVMFRGAALDGDLLMSNIFKTLIFAMAFAAYKVAGIMFKNEDPK
jgi:hypothetical protein